MVQPLKGFEKPLLQWAVVAASVVLVVLLASATLSLRRAQNELRAAGEAQRACEGDLRAVEEQLSKERAAREAFSLELARVRAQQGSSATAIADVPTLTLVPPADRKPVPPAPALAAPEPALSIQLRLLLPPNVNLKQREFQIAARDWSTGRELWSTAHAASGMVDGRRAAIAHVTGEMLKPGSYELVITASGDSGTAPEPIASYELTVEN